MTSKDEDEDQTAFARNKYNRNRLPDVSLKLTHILNESGFSETNRIGWITCSLMSYAIKNISLTIGCRMHSALGMGSFTEGTTTFGMNSDIDTLFFNPFVQAHCSIPNSNTLLGVVMIRDEETPLGYVKLQPIQFGQVINNPKQIILNSQGGLHLFENFSKDDKDRLVLSNQFQSYNTMEFDERHGPAETIVGKSSVTDQDFVRSYKCDEIPKEMEQWFDRNRNNDWPSKETRDLFKKMGCFVVPVGHPLSPERQLEWRISFSLQERHLIWHLNHAQYHCFILLKLIKKFLITPRFGKVLSSYHCKTLLFYTIEGVEQCVWMPENVIACVHLCLLRLHEWIDSRNIPNYFIPGENMFVKMETMNREELTKLKVLIVELCNSWEFLYSISFHDIGHKLSMSITNGNSLDDANCDSLLPLHIVSVISRDLIRSFKFTRFNDLNSSIVLVEVGGILHYLDALLLVLRGKRHDHTYRTFEEVVRFKYLPFDPCVGSRFPADILLDGKSSELILTEKHDEREARASAVKIVRAHIQIIFASALAARFIQTNNTALLADSYMYIELGKSGNVVSSKLTKATILLKRNLHETCNILLKQTEITSKEKLFQCLCRANPFNISGVNAFKHLVHALDAAEFRHKDLSHWLSTGCLVFGRCVFDIIPCALTFEAYRSFGAPPNSRITFDDDWFDTVVVDPLRYMYYLQYLSNTHERPAEAAVALRKLESTIFDSLQNVENDAHIETGLNILGDIFAKKGWTWLALRCFKYSYKLRPLHNAAKWHVMFLLFSPLREETYI